MVVDSQATDSTRSKVPQKSFFKKPKWAAPAASSTRTDFYRHADQTYTDIVAAKPRQLQRPQEYPKTIDEGDGVRESRKVKRRRILESETDEPEGASFNILPPGSSVSPDRLKEPASNQQCNENASPSISGHDPASTADKSITPPTTHQTPSSATVIDLDVETSEPRLSTAASPSGEGPKSDLDDDLLLEEEFPELARKARERAQQNLTRLQNRGSLPNGASHNETLVVASPGSSIAPPGTSDGDVPKKEPIAKILITSDLSNTKPLIVQRKLSQRLRDVRIAWCRRQGFSEEMTATVFLAWKGTRLFDVTTCKSLGVQKTREDDLLFMEDDISNEEEEIQIQMEAVTEELLEARKREPVDRSMERAEGNSDDDGETQQRVRLTLKSPSLDEFKLIVKPHTPVSRIISTFRKARNISPDRTIHLLFDGERLDPGSFVKDNDIADLDSIDAQIK